MSKPDDIPQDVWDRAGEVVCDEGVYAKGASHLILIERVARAIQSLEESYASVCETLSEITADAPKWTEWVPGETPVSLPIASDRQPPLSLTEGVSLTSSPVDICNSEVALPGKSPYIPKSG